MKKSCGKSSTKILLHRDKAPGKTQLILLPDLRPPSGSFLDSGGYNTAHSNFRVFPAMPRRDAPIDDENLPQIQTEKRRTASPSPAAAKTTIPTGVQEPVIIQAKSKTVMMLGVAVALCFLVIAAGAVYLHGQNLQLADARNRLLDMEERLSSTDESLSRSGVALQVTIKEMKEKQIALSGELDKLWASAWRRNQTDIMDQGNQIKSLNSTQDKNRSSIDQTNKSVAALRSELAALQNRTEELAGASKTIKSQEKLIAELKGRIDILERANGDLKRQVQESSGWVESNNLFRQQTNKTLSRLEQQLRALQATASQSQPASP